MDINRLTQKSQEALQAGETKALRYGQQEVDGEHLLLALLEQPEGLAPRLLNRMEVSPEAVRSAVERDLERRPRVWESERDVRLPRFRDRGRGACDAEVVVVARRRGDDDFG